MFPRRILSRMIIFGFLVLVGFALARAIYHSSLMGILLAFVSLCAVIYFLWLVARAGREMENAEKAG